MCEQVKTDFYNPDFRMPKEKYDEVMKIRVYESDCKSYQTLDKLSEKYNLDKQVVAAIASSNAFSCITSAIRSLCKTKMIHPEEFGEMEVVNLSVKNELYSLVNGVQAMKDAMENIKSKYPPALLETYKKMKQLEEQHNKDVQIISSNNTRAMQREEELNKKIIELEEINKNVSLMAVESSKNEIQQREENVRQKEEELKKRELTLKQAEDNLRKQIDKVKKLVSSMNM